MPKLLKPTLRERNRYLLFEAITDGPIDRKGVVDAVWGSLIRLHGELNAAKTSLWIMDLDEQKKKGIMKVNHGSVDLIRSSIALIKEISGRKAIITVYLTTGTLKKARKSL